MVRDMYVMGIDIGGSSTKCVILDAYQTICGKSLAVGGDEKETAARAIRKALADAEIDEEDLYFTAATGHGNRHLPQANCTFSEFICHAIGAHRLRPEARTVIDIGWRDPKVMRIDERGLLVSFAVGGRKVRFSGKSLEESQMHGPGAPTLAAAVHAVAESVLGLVWRTGAMPEVVLTGGAAKVDGMSHALAARIGLNVYVPPLAQYVGALGAGLYGLKELRAKEAVK